MSALAVGPLTACHAADVAIRGRAQLIAVLADATGGEVLRLSDGDYGEIAITGKRFDRPVIIVAAKGANARFDRLTVTNSTNIVLDSLGVGRALKSGEPEFTRLLEVQGSRTIVLRNVTVHGSLNGDPSHDGWGLYADGVQDLKIENCEFTDLSRGIVIKKSKEISLRNSYFHIIRSDGVDFSDSWNVSVQGNSFRDFYPNENDHPDAIQFWMEGGTTGSGMIQIRDNVILQKDGRGPQGIFISDPKGGTYQDIEITNNLIYSNDQWLGIAINGATNVTIKHNTLLSKPGDEKFMRIWLADVRDGIVDQNIAEQIGNDQKSVIRYGRNLVLGKGGGSVHKFPGIISPQLASPSSLTVSGMGYQPLNGQPD